jgi:hypothetical protein
MKWFYIILYIVFFSCKEKNDKRNIKHTDSLKYANLVDISGIYIRDEFAEQGERKKMKKNYCIYFSIYEYKDRRFGYYKIFDMDTYNQEFFIGKLYLDYDTTAFENNYRWIKKYVSDTSQLYGKFEIWEFDADNRYKVSPKELKITQKTHNNLQGEYRRINCRGDRIPYKIIP